MKEYPKIHCAKTWMAIACAPGDQEARKRALRMVVDFDNLGNAMGIEVINICLVLGKHCLKAIREHCAIQGGGIRYAYDAESDCFYLRLRQGNSVDQRAVDGSALLNQQGEIVGLEVAWHQ